MEHTIEDIAEYFEYLDALRISGATNMWGCGPYLQREFSLDRNSARQIALVWMGTFSDDSPQKRASEAFARLEAESQP